MRSTKIIVTTGKSENFGGDLLVHCIEQQTKGSPKKEPAIMDAFRKGCELDDFKGKCGEKLLVYPNESMLSHYKVKRLAVVGMGKFSGNNSLFALREKLRVVGGLIAQLSKSVKAEKIMICLPEVGKLDKSQIAEALIEGILLGDYRFLKYKTPDKKEPIYPGIKEIKIQTQVSPVRVRKGVKKGKNAAYAARVARDMANEPGNGWTPKHFADYAKDLAKSYSIECKILEKSDMRRLKMGGILAVNQGSSTPPKMVVLEYHAGKKAPTLLFVGKGLTFDSGGISLKPATGMQDMKYDMCGGAAVLSVMKAIGEEKPPVNVVSIIPSTDNMSGSSALKPGDIIRHFNAITSEIINTDAEGRLILADALAYGVKKYKPDCVVDLATLTGAVIIGLGHHYSGVLSNNEKLIKKLLHAGDMSGEPLWQLPLGKEYSKQIESKVADIKNTGGKAAGTITAACYLEKFVGDVPWAHLDIAGTAWDFTDKSYVPKGPSGVGVRTLLELVRNWPVEKAKER